MSEHIKYMERCLQLSKLGLGNVAPNPMVGSVIVHNNKIIGEGYHQQYGQAHAEVNAINAVANQSLLAKATLYVNLEPCCFTGKTPPCSELIIKHNIPKVVIGMRDPFHKVNGDGIDQLQKAGIEVIEGILEEECRELNKRFITFHQHKRPYIILKWAQTANGFFAPSDNSQYWITNEECQMLNHKWRSEEQAILIGTLTALIDNPRLNVRLWKGNNPLRIVIDSDNRLPGNLNLFDNSQPTWVLNLSKEATKDKVSWKKINDKKLLLDELMQMLVKANIQSLIVEGGSNTIQNFINANLWDEARVFTGTKILPHGIACPQLVAQNVIEKSIGNNRLNVFTKE